MQSQKFRIVIWFQLARKEDDAGIKNCRISENDQGCSAFDQAPGKTRPEGQSSKMIACTPNNYPPTGSAALDKPGIRPNHKSHRSRVQTATRGEIRGKHAAEDRQGGLTMIKSL
ncbi:MAG: hypothetical protein ONB48_06450 [candidate division KSB1 bacterium]|nr:hypothetical protein [candidate division KSB1 bacterium]MDZ7273181.1 hypothetical protein [candidate division KSB1 bacterium]MDZ7285283.1 hypothetical protein [candidate division KSB1 bacterium]MDZ7298315.1 hypothetical protein [candidate division KSB1 bacterium]MDZ7307390.1 hypothetical protein [candidate division KSB1 bacterium]